MQKKFRQVLSTEGDELFNPNDLTNVVSAFVLKLWS